MRKPRKLDLDPDPHPLICRSCSSWPAACAPHSICKPHKDPGAWAQNLCVVQHREGGGGGGSTGGRSKAAVFRAEDGFAETRHLSWDCPAAQQTRLQLWGNPPPHFPFPCVGGERRPEGRRRPAVHQLSGAMGSSSGGWRVRAGERGWSPGRVITRHLLFRRIPTRIAWVGVDPTRSYIAWQALNF